jgi:hypothetical protein
MKNWGLGIEHEMRIRFKNKISKDIGLNVNENIDNHIFINSYILLYYFNIYETTIMKDFNKYLITDKEKKYYDKIYLKNTLLNIINKKDKYPFQDKLFYNKDTEESFKNTKELIDFYINYYTLHNSPLLFFEYNFNNEVVVNMDSFMSNDYYENTYKFNNLYNHEYEKTILKYLKNAFSNKKIERLTFKIENINKITIQIDYINGKINTNTKLLTFDDCIEKINNYIIHLKKHINTKADLNGIDLNKFYKNLYLLYSNNIPEIDRSSKTSVLEFKTINYINMNYESILQDLIDLEETFLYLVNNLYIFQIKKKIFGENIVYHNIGSLQKSYEIYDIVNEYYNVIDEDYTGSYHIWITCPYTAKMSMEDFINKHIILANKLQLLEPIFAAHFSSPSYNALFNKKYSKSSLRQFINYYSSYGTSDITLMRGVDKHNIDKYYLSENDILNDIPMKTQDTFYKMPIYNNNGTKIINYDTLTHRSITNNLYLPIDKGNNLSNKDGKIHVNNYLNMIFEKTDIAPMQEKSFQYFKLGSDIRTRFLSEFFYPLDNNWDTRLLMKNNKLIEVYYNSETRKISYERIYNNKKFNDKIDNNRIGIEFRILDHFPTYYMNQILSILCPIVLDSSKSNKILKFKDTHITKQFWHDEMFNVLTKGYEYTIGKDYIKALEKEFDIKIDINTRNKNDTSSIMKILNDNLNKKYNYSRKGSFYRNIAFTSEIIFKNFNKIAWQQIIEKYFNNNPHVYRKFMYNKNKTLNGDLKKIFDKNKSYNLTKIRKILL